MNIHDEILQSTQNLMDQIDQKQPVDINSQEIEKSQAFIHTIEYDQTEMSQKLPQDVSKCGDSREDECKNLKKPLLQLFENNVKMAGDESNLATPDIQAKIDKRDRHSENAKSPIPSISENIMKTANDSTKSAKSGAGTDGLLLSNPDDLSSHDLQHESPSGNSFQFFNTSQNLPNSQSSENSQNNENSEKSQNSEHSENSKDRNMNDNLYEIVQQMKLREENLLNMVKKLSEQNQELEKENKNFRYLDSQMNNFKTHKYNPNLENSHTIETEKFEEEKAKLAIHQSPKLFELFECPEQNESKFRRTNFEEFQNDLKLNRKTIEIQCKIHKSSTSKSSDTNNKSEIITSNVTISNGKKGNHIFNYPDHLNSHEIANDLEELITLHQTTTQNFEEEEEEENENNMSCSNDNQLNSENKEINEKLAKERLIDQLETISDFNHAAKITKNDKGETIILTDNGISLLLTPNTDNTHTFSSVHGQKLNVILKNNEKMFLKIENGILLPISINKDGEVYITNSDHNKTPLFMNSSGETFIIDENGNKILVSMNEKGQIVYEMENGDFIQIATNGNGDLFYIDEEGNQNQLFISDNGEFYIFSKSGRKIPISFNEIQISESASIPIQKPTDSKETEIIENATTNFNPPHQNFYEDEIGYQNIFDNETMANDGVKPENNVVESKATPKLIPYSISRKDNQVKIIYRDENDAVVVNAGVSHCTEDGQIILTQDISKNRIRIVGGFDTQFVRRSRRKNFKWSLKPTEKSNDNMNYPSLFGAPSIKIQNSSGTKIGQLTAILANNTTRSINKKLNVRSSDDSNSDPAVHWTAFPVRPPPPCCRKRLDSSLTKNKKMQIVTKNKIIIPSTSKSPRIYGTEKRNGISFRNGYKHPVSPRKVPTILPHLEYLEEPNH
ncbi:hypothetical protein TRFO_40185 [Tritrichomonas foetus]|uniref:Uncharacterized protein n=1 Tax=Tritrichomonas foetus TaxID=1144522 RepID=A0A1J4J4A5_9EUKA|nr:hypothetical protein TRFO_40185 [Tritrichomonas foetus]|eukprot:OHS93561.1 hypothetical protein TRFO_40185 [Tritrichomonas foetus]